MRYPDVLTERETMRRAVAGASIARFGDGELSICLGGSSVSQQYDPHLRKELCEILYGIAGPVLPCIPRLDPTGPRYAYWQKYAADRHTALYRAPLFGSSFVTRPDNAPWIDRADYWDMVRSIWESQNVTFVSGDKTLADVIMSTGARSMHVVTAPKRDAYSELDNIEAAIRLPSPDKRRLVLIALGAAGTALAARLARKGFHALDLGHIGQFMKPENQGAFEFAPDQLASPSYRDQLRHEHATTHWGKGGHGWAEKLAAQVKAHKAGEVLDYGCGSGTLKPALAELGIKCLEYDPGIPSKAVLPKLADIVASTDVFEHIEPELVDNVLAHTYRLARKVGFFAIAKQPAKKILSDGRNAHLSCHETQWWVDALVRAGWQRHSITVAEDQWKKCLIICTK